jgi:hypothetical protein
MASIMSILITQCSSILACLGLWKIKKQRKIGRKSNLSVRFARAPRIDDDIPRVTTDTEAERDTDDYICFENDQTQSNDTPPPVYPRLFRAMSPKQ